MSVVPSARPGPAASRPPGLAGSPGALRVLHLEDSPLDHELACAFLSRAGHPVRALRVETEAEFRQALARSEWDVVLSDFNLPGFSGIEALQILRRPDSIDGYRFEDFALQDYQCHPLIKAPVAV